jgi:sugar porter (SP) family MFS transporter
MDIMNNTKKVSKSYLFVTSFIAALGGLLFGFDTAVISGTIPFITKYFELSDAMLGWAVSSALVGCLVGSITAGKPGDIYGRRLMLKVLAIMFLFSALGTGLAHSLTIFVIARFLGGLAIGGASVIAPMYISEIAPAHLRGRLVALSQLAIVSGILVAFFSNYLLMNTGEMNWRYMYLAGAVPAIIFFVLLFFVSQSPRWLVMVGKIDEARDVIKKVNAEEDVNKIMDEITQSINKESLGADVAIFKKPYLRLVLIGIAVGMFNQFTGINTILYYAPTIFKSAGFSQDSASLQTVMVGFTNLVFTLIAMTLIDKLGRKFLLMMGAVGMTIFLGLFANAFLKQQFEGYGLLIFVMGFIAFFAMSQGAVIWVILSEMFPNNIRARGSSIGSFSHWVFNALISFLFPIAVTHIGVGPVFVFNAVATLFSFFFFWKYLVETKGKSLEEIEKLALKK